MTAVVGQRTVPQGRSRRRGIASRIGFWVAVAWLALMVLWAVAPAWFAAYDPVAQDLSHVLTLPSAEHWLGTDAVGRDVLSRLIWGTRSALIGVAIAVGTALVLGVLWGLLAGYLGGPVDALLMRLADVFLAFPSVVLSIGISTILGGTLTVTMIAVGFALAPNVARLMRAGALVVRRRDYVESARMYGFGGWYRMLRHVAPNAFLPVLVQITIYAGVSLLAQTGLGFLSIGVDPPNPSWGASLGESFRYVNYNLWMTVFPGVVVLCTVLSFYAVGDRLQERVSVVSR